MGETVAGRQPDRTLPDDVTLLCSVGLTGTEVILAGAAFMLARLEPLIG